MKKCQVLPLTLLTVTGLGLYPALSCGADRSWTNASGGAFNVGTNWSDDTAPGTDDKAIFELDETYTVTFPVDQTTDALDFLDGTVTFDLDGETYTVSDAFELLPTSARSPSLTITGGTLEAASWTMDSDGSAQPGNLTLTGATTQGVSSGATRVDTLDSSGSLTLNILNGASLTTGSFQYNRNAHVTISGTGSILEMTGELEQQRGTAVLRVEDGGTLKTGTVWLGSRTSDSTAIVTGAASVWESGSVRFARRPPTAANKNATVLVTDGGRIESTTAGHMHETNGRAQMIVSGTGSTWDATDFFVGGRGHTITARRDEALLLVADGGMIEADQMTVHPDGTLTGNGTVMVSQSEGVNNLGGTVRPGQYEFTHTFNNADGTPEAFSQTAGLGTLTIDGNFFQTIGVDDTEIFIPTLALRIGGPGQNDQLTVLGDITLDGDLEINEFGTPLLAENDTFQLFSWTGTLSGTFSAINAFDPGENLFWDFGNLYVDGTVTVIPEPGILAFLVAALAIFALKRGGFRSGTLVGTGDN